MVALLSHGSLLVRRLEGAGAFFQVGPNALIVAPLMQSSLTESDDAHLQEFSVEA